MDSIRSLAPAASAIVRMWPADPGRTAPVTRYGKTACVTIWADNADAAKAIGQGRGIDVQQVEYGGPRRG